jgi:DNA-binding protein HU-beta
MRCAGLLQQRREKRKKCESGKITHAIKNFSPRRLNSRFDADKMRTRFAPRASAASVQEGERMASVVTKSDLVQAAARAGNVSKVAAGEAVNAVFDAIVHSVAKGNRVTVVGFGTFLPRKRKARAGRNPGNGKEIRIGSKTVPAFAAGRGFKDAVDSR